MIKDNLIAARTKKGYTQQEVADMLKVKRQTYGAYERGASLPDAETLSTLANIYDVTTDYLLGREEKSSVSSKPTEDDVKVALFGGDKEVTDEMWDEVKNFVDYVKQKRKK